MDRAQRRRETIAATVTAIGLCAGVWLIDHSPGDDSPPQPSAAEAARAGNGKAAAPMSPSPPIRVRIPAIEVDSPVMDLELEENGTLQTPPQDDDNLTGWYKHGTKPGAAGTSIFAGHVDNATGPSVFYGLGALKKGNTVHIDREDGRTAVFTVDAIEVYEREDFPSERVYGAADQAEIRLLTCGGSFSESDGYQGNVVVYGYLSKAKPKGA